MQTVIGLHLSGLKEQIRQRQDLLRRLEAVDARLRSAEEVPAAELVRTAMEVTEMSEKIEKHYAPEQLEYLRKRRQELGEERIREVEAEWPALIAAVRAEMEAGTDPTHERVRVLAQRWRALVDEFTGGNPSIEQSLRSVWEHETDLRQQTGIDRELMDYIGQAME